MLVVSHVFTLNIECNYNLYADKISLTSYRCITNNILALKEHEIIETVTGAHLKGKGNSLVDEFYPQQGGNKIYYFPQDLDKFFPNIQKIFMAEVKLREIRQTDLQPFLKLKFINLDRNIITILETDLFKFNPQLKYFSAQNNRILCIESKVFDLLNDLNYLLLSGNDYELENVKNNRTKVINLTKEIKQKCSRSQIQAMRILSFNDTQLDAESSNFYELNQLTNHTDYKKINNQLQNALSMKNMAVFLGIPIITLVTLLNILLIIVCLWKKFDLKLNDEE